MLKLKKQKAAYKGIMNLNNYIYFFILLIFPIFGFASNYGSPKEFFLFFLFFGFIFSSIIYLILGGLFFYFRRDNISDKRFKTVPFTIVVIGFFLLTIWEIISMNIISGVFGGSLIGFLIPTILYFFIIRKIEKNQNSN